MRVLAQVTSVKRWFARCRTPHEVVGLDIVASHFTTKVGSIRVGDAETQTAYVIVSGR
jgi:hypothetical protein